ncbi:hypothetical protein BH20ACI1_BH20ACI1_29090 [soil metagenome]
MARINATLKKTMMKTNSIFSRNFLRNSAKLFGLTALSLLIVLFSSADNISAQTGNFKRRTKTKISRTKPPVSKETNVETQKNTTFNEKTAVSIVNRVETDYLSGETNVSVNPKQPTVIRLGLAQNATSVVEFPLIDQIYYIHEGNPKLVTVFQSPTKETDRSITLYPGEGFLPTSVPGQKELSVTITMQMKSGLVIVLEIVPAPDIRQNAHRCVLNYNLAEVVAARRAAGLKVNLGDENTTEQVKQTRAFSRLMSGNLPIDADLEASKNDNVSPTAFIEITGGGNGKTDSDSKQHKMKTGAQLSRVVNKKLAEAIKSSKEKFTVWSPATNGLSLSSAKIIEIDDWQRLLIVAVKNETMDALRLLDEMPELQIQTVDKSGNNLQIERLTRKFVETTALAGAIPAGATVYYAVVFENPILGANQKLRVSCAHDRAADAPVTASTENQPDKKEAR